MQPLILLAAVQGLFLATLLWLRPGNRNANRWLAGTLVAYALPTLGDVFSRSGSVDRWPHLLYLFDWMVLLVGPLAYCYVVALTSPRTWRWSTRVFHGLPAFLVLLVLVPFYLLPANEKLRVFRDDLVGEKVDPLLLLAAIQVLAYWIASGWRLHRFRQGLKAQYSNLDRLKVGWLNTFLLANIVLWAAWVGSLLFGARFDWLESIAAPLAIYGLGYVGLLHASVFGVAESAPEAAQLIAPASKYAKSALSAAQISDFRQRLDRFVQLEKPYLENELTLGDLAHRVELSPHQLSQLLSVGYEQNFYEFVNGQRVAEVQRCLKDAAYAEQSVLDIAMAAGFSSKASFNAAFKKHAGLTPSAYRARPPPG
jgi:AraC-like DNA-binding protein